LPGQASRERLRVAAAVGSGTGQGIARTRITDIGVEELDRLTSTEVKRVVLRKETA
jgi:hypothetical protein